MTQPTYSAEQALALLKDGNHRFVNGLRSVDSFFVTIEKVRSLAENGQRPFATVLGCADSRVPAEVIFDRGLGDLFVPRIAGTVATQFVAASIEYASLVLGTSLCVVLGHSQCGAVQAALDYHRTGAELPSPNLAQLVGQIAPAVDTVLAQAPGDEHALLDRIVAENVRHTLKELQAMSPMLCSFIAEGKLALVGAVYDLHTGRVEFLDDAEAVVTASGAPAAARA